MLLEKMGAVLNLSCHEFEKKDYNKNFFLKTLLLSMFL